MISSSSLSLALFICLHEFRVPRFVSWIIDDSARHLMFRIWRASMANKFTGAALMNKNQSGKVYADGWLRGVGELFAAMLISEF